MPFLPPIQQCQSTEGLEDKREDYKNCSVPQLSRAVDNTAQYSPDGLPSYLPGSLYRCAQYYNDGVRHFREAINAIGY